MYDPGARRHPVQFAGTDRLLVAEVIAVHELAVEQERHRRQPDVRVRANVDAVTRLELRRTHVIEKDEGPDHAFGDDR